MQRSQELPFRVISPVPDNPFVVWGGDVYLFNPKESRYEYLFNKSQFLKEYRAKHTTQKAFDMVNKLNKLLYDYSYTYNTDCGRYIIHNVTGELIPDKDGSYLYPSRQKTWNKLMVLIT